MCFTVYSSDEAFVSENDNCIYCITVHKEMNISVNVTVLTPVDKSSLLTRYHLTQKIQF